MRTKKILENDDGMMTTYLYLLLHGVATWMCNDDRLSSAMKGVQSLVDNLSLPLVA